MSFSVSPAVSRPVDEDLELNPTGPYEHGELYQVAGIPSFARCLAPSKPAKRAETVASSKFDSDAFLSDPSNESEKDDTSRDLSDSDTSDDFNREISDYIPDWWSKRVRLDAEMVLYLF